MSLNVHHLPRQKYYHEQGRGIQKTGPWRVSRGDVVAITVSPSQGRTCARTVILRKQAGLFSVQISGRRQRMTAKSRSDNNVVAAALSQNGRPTGARMKKPSKAGNHGDDPFRLLENGQKVYLDEFDVITLLEPPPFLRPMNSLNYNHAAYLWKKIGDIPEERRHRLCKLLLPRHIKRMWDIAKLRYEDPDLFVEDPNDMLCSVDAFESGKPTIWDGRASEVPWYFSPFTNFQKAFFLGKDNKTYGRVYFGNLIGSVSTLLSPLYFQVNRIESVTASGEPCDLQIDYDKGQLHLRDSIPPGFPTPGRHLPPFNDKTCDYLRGVGPGIFVGQTWIDGFKVEQVPKKLFGEFLLIRRADSTL